MDYGDYIKFMAALVLVLGMIGGLGVLLRRYGGIIGGGAMASRHARRSRNRLSVEEVLPLDARRRLVLIRRDGREHLLLLSPQGDTVVEDGIEHSMADEPSHQEIQKMTGTGTVVSGFRSLIGGKSSVDQDRKPSKSND